MILKSRITAVLLLLICQSGFTQHALHVILISKDGLRPEFYLDKRWPAPNLQKLMKEGVYAHHMKSVFPSFTYPAHVAMLTGALPARSGIHYNAKPGSKEWNWFTKDIKVKTLWQVIKENNLTSAAVQWPVSVSDDITFNIPEIWSADHPEDRITETRKYATKGLIEEIELNATGKLSGENMSEDYLSLDANAGRMAAYIFKTYKPNLLAVHFACVDGAEHEQGREGAKVNLALASADRAIGDILEAVERSGLKESTTVIIVGDHGFSDIKKVLRPNLWIKDLDARFQPAGGSCFLYRIADTSKAVTVDTLKQEHLAKLLPLENSLHIKRQSREEYYDQWLKLITARLNLLPKNQRKLFRIIDKKELDKMGADSSALLALAAVPGIVFSGSIEGEQLTTVKGGHHGYDPDIREMYTGFISAGAGVKKGSMIKELCVTDVAVLVAGLLGIEFKCADGR